MRTQTIKRSVLWILTVSVAGLIFWLSGQTAEQSGSLSGSVTNGLLGQLFLWLKLPLEQQQTAHELVRSLAHVALFGVFGLCVSLLVRSYTRRCWIRITLPVCFVYALIDECHQHWFADGRAFEWADIAKDMIGVLLAVGFVSFCAALCKRKKRGT